MPKPTVLTGPPGPVTHEPFFSRVVEWCTDVRRAGGLRYIVPTLRRRIEIENAILDACPSGNAICRSPVVTLDRFAQNLFRASEECRLISWRAAAVIVERLLAEKAGDFPVLLSERAAPFPGVVRGILHSIRELKRFAIGPKTLLSNAGRDPKAKELGEVFRRYNAFLEENNWADTREAILVVGRRLRDRPFREAVLADLQWAVFDGFVEFSPSETPIVEALTDEVETTVVLDCDPLLPDLFPPLPGQKATFENRRHSSPFVPVARAAVAEASDGVPIDGLDLSLLEADTREQEVERIAAACKALLVDGVAQRDIAVVFPDLGRYAELVAEVFPAHGLPYSITRPAALIESPVTAAVLLLLEVPARDFERTDVVRLFRSPFVRFQDNGAAVDPTVLDELARHMRVFRGKQAWLEGLENRIAYAEGQRADSGRESDDEEDLNALRSPHEELAALGSLAAPFKTILELLDELRTARPVWGYAASLRALIARLCFRSLAMESLDKLPVLGVHVEAIEKVLEILDELKAVDEAAGPPRPITLEAFTELLRSTAAATQLSVQRSLSGIEIFDLDRAAERQSRILFLGDLVEGAVPGNVRADAFLVPQIRERMGLPDRERLRAETRTQLYRALASAGEKLVLCRPRVENETPLLRPMMLERIEAAAPLTPEPEPPLPASRRALLCALGGDRPALPPLEELLGHEALVNVASLDAFAHCHSVEREREGTGPAGRYAGRLSGRVLDEVRRAYDQEHQFSASELDAYVRCPFRFFARWLLDLTRVEEPEEEITPQDKGSALHAIFREFYAEWRNDHASGRVTKDDRDEALARLTAIARREFASRPYRGLVWEKFVERLLKPVSPTQKALPGLFDTFVDAEIHSMRPDTACTPHRFEFGFGHQRHADVLDPTSDEAPIPIIVGGRRILLRGIIDRIDVNEHDRTFCVLDYKSGSTIPSVQDMAAGLSLQLPIYIIATHILLGGHYRFAAAGYFQTKDARDCGKKHFLGDKELAPRAIEHRWQGRGIFESAQLDEFLERERRIIGAAVVGIESGHFQVTDLGADKAGCRSCDFIHICRYAGTTVGTFQDRT